MLVVFSLLIYSCLVQKWVWVRYLHAAVLATVGEDVAVDVGERRNPGEDRWVDCHVSRFQLRRGVNVCGLKVRVCHNCEHCQSLSLILGIVNQRKSHKNSSDIIQHHSQPPTMHSCSNNTIKYCLRMRTNYQKNLFKPKEKPRVKASSRMDRHERRTPHRAVKL